MIAEAVFAMFGDPTLWDLEQRSLAHRGLEDGMAGRPAASHQRAYTTAFEQGVLFRCAQERRIALMYGNGCRCPQCLSVYPDVLAGTCWCTPGGAPLELGATGLHGPADPDDDMHFYDADDLRRLCREGVQVQTTDGERLNEQILVQ